MLHIPKYLLMLEINLRVKKKSLIIVLIATIPSNLLRVWIHFVMNVPFRRYIHRYPKLIASQTEKLVNSVLHVECDKHLNSCGVLNNVAVATIRGDVTAVQCHIDSGSISSIRCVPTPDGTLHLYVKNFIIKRQIAMTADYPCYFKNAAHTCKNILCGKPCYSDCETLTTPANFMEWINKRYLREVEYHPDKLINSIYQLSDYCYWCNHSEGLPQPRIVYTLEDTFYRQIISNDALSKLPPIINPAKYMPPHVRGGKDYEKILWEKNEEIKKLKDELNTMQQDFIRLARRLGGV
jgi:hypothetical protein